mmetsp:Transcript_31708/g.67432  ORF Transcript_31708/g.67432 Transcript_31708/m.67432 type:complete len:527 (-) Transcript_31708:130-1710(-)
MPLCSTPGLCAVVLPLLALTGGSWLLSRLCFSEVAVLFSAEAMLIILWCCARRPLIGATGLYLLICCALLGRETALALTGHIPCGLSTFGRACVERQCKSHHHILWIQTTCAQYECTQMEQQEVSRTFTMRPADLLTVWLVTALAFVWVGFGLNIWHLRRWRAARVRGALPDDIERRVGSGTSDVMPRGSVTEHAAVILAVPATYGVCALHALRALTTNREDIWRAEGMMNAAELYSAIALYAFHRLLVLYVDAAVANPGSADDHSSRDDPGSPSSLHPKLGPSQLAPTPPPCLSAGSSAEHLNLRRGFQGLIAAGLKQYVLLVFACNALEVLAKAADWFRPGDCAAALPLVAGIWFPHHRMSLAPDEGVVGHSQHTEASSLACEDLWNAVSLLMVVANFFTCSIALFAVLQYERTFAKLLQPKRPFWKFLGVKGLLSVNFLQRIILMVIGLVAGNGPHTSEEFRTFLNFYLVSAESLALATLNVCAYPAMATSNVAGKASLEERESFELPDDLQPCTVLGRSSPE